MKITRSYLQQIIKEEVQQELFKTNVNNSAVISERRYKPCKATGSTIGQGLKLGCKGDDIFALQSLLNDALAGLQEEDSLWISKVEAHEKVPDTIKLDGYYGSETAEAVEFIATASDSNQRPRGPLTDPTLFTGLNSFADVGNPKGLRGAVAKANLMAKPGLARQLAQKQTGLFGDDEPTAGMFGSEAEPEKLTGYAARLTGKK